MQLLHTRILVLLLAGCAGFASCERRDQPPSPQTPAAAPGQAAPSPGGQSGPGDNTEHATTSREGAAARAAANDPVPANEAPLSLRGPQFREVTIPAGTTLRLQLETAVSSDANGVDDPVRATLRQPVTIDGVEVLPAGTPLSGAVTAAQRSGKVKGRAFVAFRFNELTIDDESYDVRTAAVSRRARGTKAKDAKTIGIPAAGGAIVGGIIAGKKGAAIGGAAGGGAGTAVVLSTRGEEVRLAAGTSINTRLSDAVTVRVPVKR